MTLLEHPAQSSLTRTVEQRDRHAPRKFVGDVHLRVVTLIAAVGLVLLGQVAIAQGYPNRPVKFIAPSPAGSNPDVLTRLLAEILSQRLSQPFIVENRPGLGGVIGTDAAAKSAANGYTLLIGNSGPLSIAPWLHTKLPYDPATDFAPIASLAYVPTVLIVNPKLGVSSVAELIARAKAKPESLTYGSLGPGSIHHLTTEAFASAAGIRMVHVPFKGTAEFAAAVLNGDLQVGFIGVPTVAQYIKDGKLRAIGISTLRRSEVLPDVPTLDESGIKGFDLSASLGVLAPGGTPADIIETLHTALTAAMADPKITTRMAILGMERLAGGPGQYEATIRSETERYGRIIRAAGIKLE